MANPVTQWQIITHKIGHVIVREFMKCHADQDGDYHSDQKLWR